jgi:hypothetical protein
METSENESKAPTRTAWIKRGERYDRVKVLREYPDFGAVKVLKSGDPEPWTLKASDIVTEKPLTKWQRERIIRRQVREERNTQQVEQVKEVLSDGKQHTIMEIVDAVNAMPRAIVRMEPARAWKIVVDLCSSGTHARWRTKAKRNRQHWAVEKVNQQ